MAELKALPTAVLIHIAKLLNVPLKGMAAVIELLDEGATVPFIARYRKEVTGNLDEVQIRDIQEKLEYFRELEDRRETVLASIQEQGKLTPELKAKIEAALEKTELEDLYLPYKPKRRTKASIAREKGLEPLALFLWDQNDPTPLARDRARSSACRRRRRSKARATSSPRWISENAEFRKAVRAMMMADGRRDQPRHRRRAGPRRQVQDVRQLQRAGIEDSVASHAGDPARRQGRRPDLRDRTRPAAAAGLAALAAWCAARRVGAAPGSGHRGFLRPPAQSLHPDRSAAGVEGPLRRRGHQGVPREPGEPAALASRRHA